MTRSVTTQTMLRQASVGLSTEELARMQRAAAVYMASGALGSRVKSVEEAMLYMVKAQELGIGDVYAMSQLYVVNGVVAMQGQVMLDMIYRSGKVKVSIDQGDDYAAITLTRIDGLCEPYTSRWDMDRVNAAGFRSPLYKNAALRGRKMLYVAVAEAARVVCPEVLSGTYAVEEFGVADLSQLTPGIVNSRLTEMDPPVGAVGKAHAKVLHGMLAELDAREANIVLGKYLADAGVRNVGDMGSTHYYQLVSSLEHALHVRGVKDIPVAPNLDEPPQDEPDALDGDFEPETAPTPPRRLEVQQAPPEREGQAIDVSAQFPNGDTTPLPVWRTWCNQHGMREDDQQIIQANAFGRDRDPVDPDEMLKLLVETLRYYDEREQPHDGLFGQEADTND